MYLQPYPVQLNPLYVYSPQNEITSEICATMITLNWPSPVSKLTTANKVDNDTNNYDDSQNFATPKKNHIGTEIRDTNTTNSQVHINIR